MDAQHNRYCFTRAGDSDHAWCGCWCHDTDRTAVAAHDTPAER